MPIFIETLILFNIYIDFIVILMTSIILKQYVSKKNIISASLIGGLSTIILFIKITTISLIILQMFISFIIILVAFGKKSFFKKIVYFYINSILLGGIIFAINNIVFLSSIANFIILIVLTPLIVMFYREQIKKLKTNYNLKYKVNIKYKDKFISLNSFFDTGNSLIDPYFNKPVILINEDLLEIDNYFYIPYNTITEKGIIKGILVDEIEIVGLKSIKKIVVGLLPNKLRIDDVDCLLNYKIMEELND